MERLVTFIVYSYFVDELRIIGPGQSQGHRLRAETFFSD